MRVLSYLPTASGVAAARPFRRSRLSPHGAGYLSNVVYALNIGANTRGYPEGLERVALAVFSGVAHADEQAIHSVFTPKMPDAQMLSTKNLPYT